MKTEESKTIYWISAIVVGFVLVVAVGIQLINSSNQVCVFTGILFVLGYFSIASFYEFLKKQEATNRASRIILILAGIISIPVGFVILVRNVVSSLFQWLFGKPG